MPILAGEFGSPEEYPKVMSRYLFFSGVLFFLLGCNNATQQKFEMPSFRQEVRAKAEVIASGYAAVHEVEALFAIDSYLVLVKNRTVDNSTPFVEFYDKESGELLHEAILKGRGPGEVAYVVGADLNPATGDMVLADGTGKSILMFNIYDLLAPGETRFEKRPKINWTQHVFKLNDGLMLFENSISKRAAANGLSRFEIRDARDSLRAAYDEFPIRDTVTDINFYLHQQARLSLSSDRKRLVSGTLLRGAMLECFDVTADGIAPRWTKYLVEPAYDKATGKRIEKGRLSGFMDVYAADDAVVTVLSDDRQDKVHSICIFDWKGDAVKRIAIEDDYLDVYRVCMDARGDIYAIMRDKEDSFYLARIVETGPAPDGYRVSEEKIGRFSPEENSEPSTFSTGA